MAGPGSPKKDELKQGRLGAEGSLEAFYSNPGEGWSFIFIF